jgi:hypothetical protein
MEQYDGHGPVSLRWRVYALFHFPKVCASTCAAVGPIAGAQVDSAAFALNARL